MPKFRPIPLPNYEWHAHTPPDLDALHAKVRTVFAAAKVALKEQILTQLKPALDSLDEDGNIILVRPPM